MNATEISCAECGADVLEACRDYCTARPTESGARVRLTARGRMLAGLAFAFGLAGMMAGLEGLAVVVTS